MLHSYSLAEARNRFAEIVHDLERVGRIEVTRRGRRVAVLISVEEYERLCNAKSIFLGRLLGISRFGPPRGVGN